MKGTLSFRLVAMVLTLCLLIGMSPVAYGAERQYTITFISMGGTSVPPITGSYNTLVTAPVEPTRENYVFAGWFTNEDGTGTQYFVPDGPEVRMLEDLYLFASWATPDPEEPTEDPAPDPDPAPSDPIPETITVTFAPGAGSVSYSTKTATVGSAIGVLPEAERAAYQFRGWFTAAEGGVQVTAETVVEKPEDVTLYAQYSLLPGDYSLVERYLKTISEAGDLGIYNDESILAIQTAMANVVWNLGADQQTQIDEMARAMQKAWNERQRRRVTVTFDAGEEGETSTVEYRYLEPYAPLPTVTRKGHTFLGWFTAKEGGTQVDGEMLVKETADHTLYAHWQFCPGDYEPIDRALTHIPSDLTPYTDETRQDLKAALDAVEYGLSVEDQAKIDAWAAAIEGAIGGLTKKRLTVTFDARAGTVTTNSQSVIYGETAILPQPTREGYIFVGWHDADGETYLESTPVTEPLTLYAHWKEAPADYTALNQVLSEIPSDLGIYTKASVEALERVKTEIRPELGSTQQTQVDAWAADLRAAVDGLVKKLPFGDVSEGDWFYDSVSGLYYAGIVNGVGDGTNYAPTMVTDRAQMAVLLHRISGEPEPTTNHSFADVGENAYFCEAVSWAAEQGIVRGTGDGSTYSPYLPITREMFATMLYRLFGAHKVAGSLAEFPDGKSVSNWALEGMTWAVETGIITGKGDGTLAPQGEATRAEVATMLHRYLQLVK